VSTADSLAALDKLFKVEVAASDVAAIIFEPVQGEGGFVPAPKEFVANLRRVCDQHGILMIADEIQTGFGRTGKLFAMEHFGVAADLTTMAKSIAGGMPLSAVCGRAEVMDAPAPGGLGGTFAGNAVAIAAGHAVLDIIDSEQLLDRANALGDRMAKKLKALAEEVPAIAEIRVLGSMVGVEFFDPTTGKPDGEVVNRIRAYAVKRGLLVLACGLYGNVIRFLHPLTISDALLDEGLGIFSAAVHASVK
jgi:4-aminobutyrate aminotransferase